MRQTALQRSMGIAATAGKWPTAFSGTMGTATAGSWPTALSETVGTAATAGKWPTALSGSSANVIGSPGNAETVSVGEGL